LVWQQRGKKDSHTAFKVLLVGAVPLSLSLMLLCAVLQTLGAHWLTFADAYSKALNILHVSAKFISFVSVAACLLWRRGWMPTG
jgi:hypothetical protein